MSRADSTCWTVIKGAAKGQLRDREEFARRYESVIRAYLVARWRGSTRVTEIDDAVQDVFVDCFREDGALERADPKRSFRAFLYGVVRNVARRNEEKHARRREMQASTRFDLEAREESLSKVFDRAWAHAIMRQAGRLQAERARAKGGVALRRMELLRLRFNEAKPMREIAREWDMEAGSLQYEYARAREEFEAALREIVRDHRPDTAVEEECASLLQYFS
jgi:RNA polymerase sigma-70 factor (ECF subfamily)